MRARLYISSLIVVAATACSSGGGAAAASSGSGDAARPARGGPNLITEAEIMQNAIGVQNALEIVERLRPGMLRVRASSTFGQGSAPGEGILVYVDEIRLGDVSNLRTVPTQQVKEVRWISATDATQRWGTGHGSGVIQVITRK